MPSGDYTLKHPAPWSYTKSNAASTTFEIYNAANVVIATALCEEVAMHIVACVNVRDVPQNLTIKDVKR